jgi:hypothetical protein
MTANTPIVIMAGLQRYGTTYQLHPNSVTRLRAAFPDVQQAPKVFVGYDTQADFERTHGRMWAQIVQLLTGVNRDELVRLGGAVIRIPTTGKEYEVKG